MLVLSALSACAHAAAVVVAVALCCSLLAARQATAAPKPPPKAAAALLPAEPLLAAPTNLCSRFRLHPTSDPLLYDHCACSVHDWLNYCLMMHDGDQLHSRWDPSQTFVLTRDRLAKTVVCDFGRGFVDQSCWSGKDLLPFCGLNAEKARQKLGSGQLLEAAFGSVNRKPFILCRQMEDKALVVRTGSCDAGQ